MISAVSAARSWTTRWRRSSAIATAAGWAPYSDGGGRGTRPGERLEARQRLAQRLGPQHIRSRPLDHDLLRRQRLAVERPVPAVSGHGVGPVQGETTVETHVPGESV